MTDISVSTTPYQVEKRSWLIPQPDGIGFGYTPSCTLDQSAFTAGTHFPNGYFPSGLPISELTPGGLWGPGDSTLTNKHGYLFSAVKVPTNGADPGGAVVQAFAVVRLSKLPIAPNGALQAKTPLIHFVA